MDTIEGPGAWDYCLEDLYMMMHVLLYIGYIVFKSSLGKYSILCDLRRLVKCQVRIYIYIYTLNS